MTLPAMSVHVYLVRIRRFTKFDLLCFLIAVWYTEGQLPHRGDERFARGWERMALPHQMPW